MNESEFFQRVTVECSAQFAEHDNFADFAASLDASKPGTGRLLQNIAQKYPNGYWSLYYATIKVHGFVGRALLMPKATKCRDIFADVSLYPYESGGLYRHQIQHVRAGAAYISGRRAPGFEYFGRLGAIYEWSQRWLERGEKIKSIRGGTQWLTGAIPTQATVDAYGAIAGPGEWELGTFEAIKRDDGILVTAKCNNGFGSRWLALLDSDECALDMLDDHERGEIEAEIARRDDAWRN